MRSGAWNVLLGAAAAVVVIAGLRAASSVLIPVVVAGLLTLVTFPLVRWLRDHGIPPPLAVVLTIVLTIAALAGPVAIVATVATRFAARVPQYRSALQQMSATVLIWLEGHGISGSLPFADVAAIFDWTTMALGGLVALLSSVFLIILVTAFMLLEAADVRVKLRAAFGLDDRALSRLVEATQHVYQFLWLKTLVSAATGLAAGLWCTLWGIEFAVLWGLVAFLLNYIPNFGSLIAALPPVLLAAIQFGLARAALVAAGYVALNITLGSILEPRVIGRRLGMSPLALLVSLLFWGWLWGPIGFLLAVPMTMGARLILEEFQHARWLAVLISSPSRLRATTPTVGHQDTSPTDDDPAHGQHSSSDPVP
jgi:AI-2 transport protein TqsA